MAGGSRRRRDTVGDLDVVVTAKDGAAVGDKLVGYENVAQVLAHGPTRTTVVLRSGLQVDVRAVPEDSYGAARLSFTAPRRTILRCAESVHRGWRLNEYGLFSGRRRIAGLTEEEIYKKLRLAFILPNCARTAARSRSCDQQVAAPRDDKRHSRRPPSAFRSDPGAASIEAMAEAAQARGYAYIALTDHSRRVAMTHRLDSARLSRQAREIDHIDEHLHGITILKGIEVDILKDGKLDLPDASLAKLDVVVAAVHSYFDLPRDAQTDGVIRAMHNRYVLIVAHPTGRLIGDHEPYDIDMERVIAAARDLGCHLEVNSQPDRLDLNDNYIHAAKRAGVTLAISTDADSVDAFECIRFGVDPARRGWLTADDVINTRSLADLRDTLQR